MSKTCEYSQVNVNPNVFVREYLDSTGKIVSLRKYHLTKDEMSKVRSKWLSTMSMSGISVSDNTFFNPYQLGSVYYSGVQSLYLLGTDTYHSYGRVKQKLSEVMSGFTTKSGNNWERFSQKTPRIGAIRSRDLLGRIVDNFKTIQRLRGLHPFGYKLKQVHSCIDIKRDYMGIWYFCLRTGIIGEIKPIYDMSEFCAEQEYQEQLQQNPTINNE